MPHIGPVDVPEGRKSSAWWSTAPTGAAVVFVHGFGGSSVGTWSEFEQRLPYQDVAAGADILFYGYDGLRTSAQTSAIRLREVLHEWMSHPNKFVNGTLPPSQHRRLKHRYSKLIVVAHSLGAVVARKALLDAFRLKHPWLAQARLVLFAPAHRGASLLALAKTSLSGMDFMLAMLGMVRHFSVLADLDEDGPFLKTLIAHHEVAVKLPGGAQLAAIAICVPPADPIVTCVDFLLEDAAHVEVPNSTHSSVCKPTDRRTEPLELIRSLLP